MAKNAGLMVSSSFDTLTCTYCPGVVNAAAVSDGTDNRNKTDRPFGHAGTFDTTTAGLQIGSGPHPMYNRVFVVVVVVVVNGVVVTRAVVVRVVHVVVVGTAICSGLVVVVWTAVNAFTSKDGNVKSPNNNPTTITTITDGNSTVVLRFDPISSSCILVVMVVLLLLAVFFFDCFICVWTDKSLSMANDVTSTKTEIYGTASW